MEVTHDSFEGRYKLILERLVTEHNKVLKFRNNSFSVVLGTEVFTFNLGNDPVVVVCHLV
jgi:hypothetical protein